MRGVFLSLLALGSCLAPASAADLSKIDRLIAKEPVYQTRRPTYCLLVFGLEAKTRVWLVRDGNHLYVDRNADGDLTGPSERAAATKEFDVQRGGVRTLGCRFDVPDVTEVGGKVTHTKLHLDFVRLGDDPEHAGINIQVSGWGEQFTVGGVVFAKSRTDAPVVHFGGFLRPFLRTEQVALGDEPTDYQVCFGTPGIGEHTLAYLTIKGPPLDKHPKMTIEFATKAGKVARSFELDQRC